MQGFINEFQRRHCEACQRAQEELRKHPMGTGEARERAQRIRDLAAEDSE